MQLDKINESASYPKPIDALGVPGLCTAACHSVSVSVPFHKDIIFPTLHPQKDLAEHGECCPMIGVNSDLRH
jgi:hypothetical protein